LKNKNLCIALYGSMSDQRWHDAFMNQSSAAALTLTTLNISILQ